jgi:tetratricopeptide (TPR) repeat protein
MRLMSRVYGAAAGQTTISGAADDRLRYGTVLAELGELYDAEIETEAYLEERSDDLTGIDLLAKIKHMRGELSEAISWWSRVREKAPPEQAAQIRLNALLQFARESERAPGNFVALGPHQIWRKPAALLELERAFRLFVEHRPDEARARCEELARKYRATDADVYKLAVLANAWIAELSGDFDSARAILESMGNDRGFEADGDRVLALARLYERIGTPELLEKTVNVFQHFLRGNEKVSVLGHLASLCRQLGRKEEAAAYERRFLDLFRRRMHRPSFEDVVKTAAQHYVPLDKLAAIRLSNGDRTPPDGTLERAIALALGGDRTRARELLDACGDTLGLSYRADLAVLEGSFDDAVPLYLKSLRQVPNQLRVIGRLLAHHGSPPSSQVVEYFRRPETAQPTLERLEAALHASPVRPTIWWQMATLLRILGRTEEADRCARRATFLEEAAGRAGHPAGRVLAAAVYHLAGEPKGLVHEVWATRRLAERGHAGFLEEILGNLTAEMTGAVRNVFLSVREYARAKWPERTRDILDYAYGYKVTKEDEASGGLSAGLPTALAFLSVFLDQPVPQTIASTGALVADAHDVLVVRPIGEAEFKVRGAYNRNLAKILLPAGNRRDLEGSCLVPDAACREIVAYVSDLDEAVVHAFGKDVWLT